MALFTLAESSLFFMIAINLVKIAFSECKGRYKNGVPQNSSVFFPFSSLFLRKSGEMPIKKTGVYALV
jgi:hypothetical protein